MGHCKDSCRPGLEICQGKRNCCCRHCIDTGVRHTHHALRDNWRSNYGWYDPYEKTSTPNDGNGHGTHTMGTIVGTTEQIGVSPDANWIACKGCMTSSCSGSALFQCGQWVQCPTDPDGSNADCTKAPHVVSNSWMAGKGSNWYDGIINSWQSAGIIPVFSMGNSGPSCSTAESPADRPNVIAVGSIDSNDQISSFSSRGPSNDGKLKPEISAPGGKVTSAWHTGDTVYNVLSGTSMACPHVSGVVALMRGKNPSANFNQILKAITSTAMTNSLDKTGTNSCGGKSQNSYPNNVYGYGCIDAVNSIKAI